MYNIIIPKTAHFRDGGTLCVPLKKQPKKANNNDCICSPLDTLYTIFFMSKNEQPKIPRYKIPIT